MSRLKIDKYVHIALGREIFAEDRSEEVEPLYVMLSAESFDLLLGKLHMWFGPHLIAPILPLL